VLDYHIAVVPVGRVDVEEMKAAVARAAKVLHRPIEVRELLPVPRGAEDTERGQHRAADVLKRLGAEVLKLKQGVLVGGDDPDQKPPFQVDGFLFVTDVDLYTARTDGVMGALISKLNCALVSVRRQREAFYKRKANPTKQRSRLVKELLRMGGRLRGMKECADPECVLAPSRSVHDLDTKEERFCRGCETQIFEGKLRL
jgi:predicted Zn-dependent protease